MASLQIPCEHMMEPEQEVCGTPCFPEAPRAANRWTTESRVFFDATGNIPVDLPQHMLDTNFRVVDFADTKKVNASKIL